MDFSTLFVWRYLELSMLFLLPSLSLAKAVSADMEDTLRLVDDGIYNNSNQGRVEVYYEQRWGTVCSTDWGQKEADVVCRQLGLGDVLTAKTSFGPGTGPILGDVHCHSNDITLLDCDHGGWGDNSCTHDDDVAVICLPEYHEETQNGLASWEIVLIVVGFGASCVVIYKIVHFIFKDEDEEEEEDRVHLQDAAPSVSALVASQVETKKDPDDTIFSVSTQTVDETS